MERPTNARIDPTVFGIAAAISAAFVLWGILGSASLANVFNAVLYEFLVPNFGWVFVLSSFGFLAFSLYLAFSRFGNAGGRRAKARAEIPMANLARHLRRGDDSELGRFVIRQFIKGSRSR